MSEPAKTCVECNERPQHVSGETHGMCLECYHMARDVNPDDAMLHESEHMGHVPFGSPEWHVLNNASADVSRDRKAIGSWLRRRFANVTTFDLTQLESIIGLAAYVIEHGLHLVDAPITDGEALKQIEEMLEEGKRRREQLVTKYGLTGGER